MLVTKWHLLFIQGVCVFKSMDNMFVSGTVMLSWQWNHCSMNIYCPPPSFIARQNWDFVDTAFHIFAGNDASQLIWRIPREIQAYQKRQDFPFQLVKDFDQKTFLENLTKELCHNFQSPVKMGKTINLHFCKSKNGRTSIQLNCCSQTCRKAVWRLQAGLWKNRDNCYDIVASKCLDFVCWWGGG